MASSTSRHSPLYFLAGIIFICVGLIMSYFGVSTFFDSKEFEKHGVVSIGKVESVYTTRNSKGKTVYNSKTLFKAPSGEKFYEVFKSAFSEGQSVSALILKNNSGVWHAKQNDFFSLYGLALVLVVMGPGFLIAGVIQIRSYLNRVKEVRRLRAYGRLMKAKITGVLTKKTKHSYYSIIIASPQENVRGVDSNFQFQSEPISGQIMEVGLVGNEVQILIDNNDAKSYLFEYR